VTETRCRQTVPALRVLKRLAACRRIALLATRLRLPQTTAIKLLLLRLLRSLRRFADHGSGLTVPGINDLFLDQPLAIHLHAGIGITAHGAYRFTVSLGVPLYRDPVRGDAVASPIGFLDKKMLDVMLSTTPVGTREEMRGKSPGATLGSIPSFPGDILDHAVGRKGGDDTFNIAGIHAPHIPRQRVVNLLTIL